VGITYKSIIGCRTRCISRNRYKYEGFYSCQEEASGHTKACK